MSMQLVGYINYFTEAYIDHVHRLLTGSKPGNNDVIPFTEVGVVNDVIITGLHLQSGHTYYATVRGT